MWKIHLSCHGTRIKFMHLQSRAGQEGRKSMSSHKPWKQQTPIHVWRTWPDDHVTVQEPSERSAAILSRLQWKTTAASYCTSSAARHHFFFGSLSDSAHVSFVFFLPPLFSLALVGLCQHIPQSHPPHPCLPNFSPLRLEILSE